jgi:hypothetical protein
MTKTTSTPTCPGCGAKFKHDAGTLTCKACGIPDEIASLGPQMIIRWQKDKLRGQGASKRSIKAYRKISKRKRRPHGRPRGT